MKSKPHRSTTSLECKWIMEITKNSPRQQSCHTDSGTPCALEVRCNCSRAGVRYSLLCNFGDENGVGLHGQRVGHASQRLVETGQQHVELGRCKSEGREIEADLLVRRGHVQDNENRFVPVATKVSKRMEIIFVDGNVAAVEECRLAVAQREKLAVKTEDGVLIFHFGGDVIRF